MKKWIVVLFSGLCLSCAASTVSIEVQFVQVDLTNSAFEGLVTNLLAMNHGQPDNGRHRPQASILTNPQFQIVQRALMEETNGAYPFVTTRVTTDSKRQAEIEMTDTATNTANDILKFNLRLTVMPIVSTNGYAIEMHFTPTTENSLPYFKPLPRPHTNSVPVTTLSDVLPPGFIVQDSIGCTIWDGQTIVLEGFPDHVSVDRKRNGQRETLVFSETRKKRLLVFVTAALVDEHDQPIHSEKEMPKAQTTIPPQTHSTTPDL